MAASKNLVQSIRLSLFGQSNWPKPSSFPAFGAIVSTDSSSSISNVQHVQFRFPSTFQPHYEHTKDLTTISNSNSLYNLPTSTRNLTSTLPCFYFSPYDQLSFAPSTPTSFTLGIGAAATPFLTNTPYSLYLESKQYPQGQVSMKLLTPNLSSSSSSFSSSHYEWSHTISHSLRLWGKRNTLVSCHGNVIANLGSTNSPMSEFLEFIRQSNTCPSKVWVALYQDDKDRHPFFISSLAAGSTYRGTLLLNSEIRLTPGMKMHWMIQEKDSNPHFSQLRINGVHIYCPSGFAIACKKTNQMLMFRDAPLTVDVTYQFNGVPIEVTNEKEDMSKNA